MSTRFDARRIAAWRRGAAAVDRRGLRRDVLILFVAGDPVGAVWQTSCSRRRCRARSSRSSTPPSVYYLSAIAVAIGFRMNLFNIGVDGQYRVASFAAALFAGQGWLPGWLNIIVALFVAMVSGALWAGIAGVPQGDARRLRGHLHDHAQRDRDLRRGVPAGQDRRAGPGQQRDPAPSRCRRTPRGSPASRSTASPRRRARSTGSSCSPSSSASSTGSSSTRRGSASTCARPAAPSGGRRERRQGASAWSSCR